LDELDLRRRDARPPLSQKNQSRFRQLSFRSKFSVDAATQLMLAALVSRVGHCSVRLQF